MTAETAFYRWLSGNLAGLPHPSHCRILEMMIPGWTVQAIFEPWPGDDAETTPDPTTTAAPMRPELAGITAVYTSRTEFSHEMPPTSLFDDATTIDAVGLSLNLICQQYPDLKLRALLRRASVRLLFLDPDGESVKRRNREEGHEEGHLSAWSNGNINIMKRLREDLAPEAAARVQLRVYDETIRFNLMFIDNQLGVMQTYLPALRGLDSPTFMMQRSGPEGSDLYSVYSHVFTSFWERGRPL